MPDTATDSCFENQQTILNVEQAIAGLLSNAKPTVKTECIQLMAGAGRILSQDLRSLIDVPGFDNSAMDGYAINTGDLELAGTKGLQITQRIPAGSTSVALQPGCCARIFTGAPIPDSANAVAIQEICRVENKRIFFDQTLRSGENIRPRGNDITTGSTILCDGTLLRAAHLGLAASVGIAAVDVYRKLTVAIFSTGDELVEPGKRLAPGQIYNSNRYQLRALLESQGCEVIDLGTVPDTFAASRDTLLEGAKEADLVMTTGGVSVGEEDHIKSALESVGELTMWRVRMKPGKPLVFGCIGETPFIGLPGNPVAVFVTFLLFARPYLQTLQGRKVTEPRRYEVRAGFDYRTKQRREYVRVRLNDDATDGITAEAFSRQGSDVMSSVAWSDGLVEIPEEATVQVGNIVRFLPFSEWAQ